MDIKTHPLGWVFLRNQILAANPYSSSLHHPFRPARVISHSPCVIPSFLRVISSKKGIQAI
ncbi:MAG: hypothetical protein A2X70_04045 [Alphaproteobacteria bacterium GWC2_42_16]|nr:MAG: hypothetical protein A2X70_04045 [Alphaproteobacteria bacterium GWC2_42_16]OFW83219.1 MAG: hypothetical protein A3E50_00955 [Alphaproteobacteria bacterium RIFCSPHIGHO2_12_FULL_42_100]